MKPRKKTSRPKRKPIVNEPTIGEMAVTNIGPIDLPDLNAINERIHFTADILKRLDEQDAMAGSGGKGDTAHSANSLSKADSADSNQNPGNFKLSLAWLARHAVNGLWEVVNHGNGKQARGALKLLMNEIVYANTQLELLLTNKEKRVMVCEYAGRKIEFPILFSLFTDQNKKAKKRAIEELGLGTKLPFRFRNNTTYTAYNKLAIKIVLWIDDERSRASSIYLRVAPDLDKNEFRSIHGSTWEKAIAFHLDYFQSPEKRWKTVNSNLAEKLAGVSRDEELAHLKDNVGPIGDVTEISEFKSILTDRRDSNVRTQMDLYHRVKNKIIDGARRLMQ